MCTSSHTGMCTVMTRIMMISDKAGLVMASMYDKSEAERQGNGGALMTLFLCVSVRGSLKII